MAVKFEITPAMIQQLKLNDRAVQKLVYQNLAPTMMAVCKRYLPDTFDAEEAFQHAFIKVFQSIQQFKSDGVFEGWVRRIMVNECLLILRKQKNVILSIESSINSSNEPHHYDIPDAQYNSKELIQLIHTLPYGYRTVLNLYAIEGYSHAEIAQLLQISEGTSKSQLSRAREAFRTKLSQLQSQQYAN